MIETAAYIVLIMTKKACQLFPSREINPLRVLVYGVHMFRADTLVDLIALYGDVLTSARRALALAFNHVRQWQGMMPSVAAVLEEVECARRNIPENVLRTLCGNTLP